MSDFRTTRAMQKFFRVCLCIAACIFASASASDRIRLRDISSLTFYADEKAVSRRFSPEPQLKCVKGSACGSSELTPRVVQCTNKGLDDHGSINWSCESSLKSSVSLGMTNVVCEGYSRPGDEYVLAGSCFLEYELVFSGSASSHHRDYASAYYDSEDPRSWGQTIGTLVFCGFLAFLVIKMCCRDQGADVYSRQVPPRGPTPSFFGGPGGDGGPSDYRGPGSGPSYGGSCSPPNSYGSSSAYTPGRPGFWTGAATGGMLGYLFGASRNNQSGPAGYDHAYRSGYGGHHRGSSSSSSSSSSTRSSTGFGRTTVR
eukprot:ANDGO_03339.mRNA.1 Store-operated calcium entry-associated regulatory factor